MASKRIYILSTAQSEPMQLVAGYANGTLHIVEHKRLHRSLAKLKETLPDKLDDLRQKGFIVLVDEIMPVFAKHGRSARLGHVGSDGRPILVSALETYRNMRNLQAISFPAGMDGVFDVSDSIVEEVRDGNGRLTYNIDWSELKAESVILLLAVYAATQDSLYDAPTAMNLMKALGARKQKPAAISPFLAITRKINNALSADALEPRE